MRNFSSLQILLLCKNKSLILDSIQSFRIYLALFALLHFTHSIWQFSFSVFPPLLQGIIWSASICSSSSFSFSCGRFMHFISPSLLVPISFCFSYVALFMLSPNALRLNAFYYHLAGMHTRFLFLTSPSLHNLCDCRF